MRGYKTVLFDADGTLYDFDRCETEALLSALKLSCIVGNEDIVSAYKSINDSLWKALERGEIERQTLSLRRFEMLCERFALSCDPKIIAKNYVLSLAKKTFLIEGANELLSNLYGKVRMYIITNGIAQVQKSRYSLSSISHFFDGIFISEQIGANKPQEAFFDYVASHIDNFSLEDTLVVGDSLTSDILGGNLYGLDTCWFSPRAEKSKDIVPKFVVRSLAEVADIVLGVKSEQL